MTRFEKSSILESTPEEVFAWHSRPGALARLSPPWQVVRAIGEVPGVEVGSRVHLRLGVGPFATRWTAEHTVVEPGAGFEDVQIAGPFRSWRHRHLFEPASGGRCRLRDVIDYQVPAGFLGRSLAGGFIERSLEKTFAYRHLTTAADLSLHRRYAAVGSLRVGVTGSSGLIGSVLTTILTTGGHQVVRLVRSGQGNDSPDVALWDPRRGILEPSKVEGLDAVVHLAAESVGEGRWSRSKMRHIRESRISGTRILVESLGGLERPPATFVSASGIGYYGDTLDETVSEGQSSGSGFLAELGERWEAEASRASSWARRVVRARFGVVLSPRGGALAKMLPAFRLAVGGRIGSGSQYMSWISIDDAAAALIHVLQSPDLEGPVNLVAPQPIRNREFVAALAKALRRPALLPLPSPLARALFGRMAEPLLLTGNRVWPQRLLDSGYPFRHPELLSTLTLLLGR